MKRVVILGHNFMTRLNVARAAKQAGCEVICLCIYYGKTPILKPVDAYSNAVDAYHYVSARNEEKIKLLLLNKCRMEGEKVLLIPCSDYTVSVLDKYSQELEAYFYLPVMKGGSKVVSLMNKSRQKEVAEKVGVKVAKSWIVDVTGAEITIPSVIEYPCFPKSLQSISGGKLGMVRCNTPEELRESLVALKKNRSKQVLVEQFLTIDKEYALVGVSDGTQVYIPGVLYLKEVAKGAHNGVAVAGQVEPASDYRNLLESYASFVREVGLTGLFDLDFFYCQGEFYLGEMNMRIGASAAAYLKGGVNLVKALIESYEQNDGWLEVQKEVKEICPFLNDNTLALEWQSGDVNYEQVLQRLGSADSFFCCAEDPEPLKQYKRRLSLLRIKQAILQVVKR